MKRASFFLLVFALAMNPLDGFAQKNENPEKIVEKFHSVLLDVMKEAKSLSAKERYIKLEPAIDTAYDLGFMVRVASGIAWRKTSDDHKIKLAKAFQRMSIATYAFRFKGYSGQRFETLKVGNGPRKTKLVFTQIISPPKKNTKREIKVKLTYVTKNIKGKWKIIDVLLGGGISELSVKHSEYRRILRTKGAFVLAELLDKKADKMVAN